MEVDLYPITYWLVGFFGFIFVFGVVSNSAVAFASYHEPKLRNACNILVALCCLSDGLHTCGHITLIYAFSTGNLFMNSMTCVWFQVLPVIGQHCGCGFTVAVGIDRLYACFNPMGYNQKNSRVYIACHLVGVALYVCVQMYNIISNLYPLNVICMVPAIYMGSAKETFWNISLTGFVLDVIIYAIAGIRIKTNSMLGNEGRIFMSLLLILTVLILGHIGAILTANILISNILNPDFKTWVVMDLVIGVPVNIAMVCNYLIYFTTSSEYRRAFRSQFAYLFGNKSKKSVSVIVSSGAKLSNISSHQ